MNISQSPTEGRAAASTSDNGPVDPLLTLPEIANELRCSKGHVSNLMNGKVPGVPLLPTIALGRRRLVRRSSFEHWKKQCEAATLAGLNNAVGAAKESRFMRKRFQKGSLKKKNGSWIGQWREYGRFKSQALGRIREVTKAQALIKLADILRPINCRETSTI